MINQIVTGDARELTRAISDNSIDLIFCDPPYLERYISLYEWLGEEGSRILKPGAFLLAYTGMLHKFETMTLLAKSMKYFADFITLDGQRSTILWHQRLIARHKSILAFSKGKGWPRRQTLTSWQGGGADKRFHRWGQDESTARYYIDCFSAPGDTILDPFAGGGTVPAVCKQLNRNFIAFEIDPATADVARKRLEIVQPMLSSDLAETRELWEVVS